MSIGDNFKMYGKGNEYRKGEMIFWVQVFCIGFRVKGIHVCVGATTCYGLLSRCSAGGERERERERKE